MQKLKRFSYRLYGLLLLVLLCLVPSLPADEGVLPVFPYRLVFAISDLLHLPSDVGVDGQGKIYILDGTAGSVRVYDRHGSFLFTLGAKLVLNQSLGLDVSSRGDVLIADSGNHRLVLFPADKSPGRFLDIPPRIGDKLPDPTDALFGSIEGTFHVVDNDNHRIVTLDTLGKVVWSRGTMGRNPEEFRFPFMIDVDREGNLYVVEVINTRIQVLAPDGTHIRFIGDWGIEPGQFYRPKGIAISDNNEIFVSDSYLGVIQVFSREGEFLGAVGDEKGQLRKFITPVGLTFSENRLFVVEMFSNRLLVLEKMAL